MTYFVSAFWVEALKMRRSSVPYVSAIGFSMIPLMGGLFMIILKDPEAARSMGLISTKAQLLVGVADWPTFFNILSQGIAVGGGIVFSIITMWVFGREFSDRTAKELLALPTPREVIVAVKFMVIALWTLTMTVFVFGISLLVGSLVVIPGGSSELVASAFINVLGSAVLVTALMPFVALLASTGRGYLPAFGWVIFTTVLAQIAAITGWGDWFPWSIPALFSGALGPRSAFLGIYSYALVIITSLLGLAATFYWWQNADQSH